jgi:diguanylate cyclase (GGDEF)-like protein
VLADHAGLIGPDTISRLPRVRGSSEAVRLSIALRSLVLRIGSAERSRTVVQDRAAEEAAKMNRDLAILRNLAEVDALTELLNRRAFMERARDAMHVFWGARRAFAVLMIDIDHFKRINDTLGHPAGDTVIRAVAGVIAHAIRPEDKAARFGGEEFLILLHDTSRPEAREAAERIRALVAATTIDCNGHPLAVTISIGVAVSDPSDADVQALIERADVALYAAKEAGRDQVVVAVAGIQFQRRTA